MLCCEESDRDADRPPDAAKLGPPALQASPAPPRPIAHPPTPRLDLLTPCYRLQEDEQEGEKQQAPPPDKEVNAETRGQRPEDCTRLSMRGAVSAMQAAEECKTSLRSSSRAEDAEAEARALENMGITHQETGGTMREDTGNAAREDSAWSAGKLECLMLLDTCRSICDQVVSQIQDTDSENPHTVIVSFKIRDDGHNGFIQVPRHKVCRGKSDKVDFQQGMPGTKVFSYDRILVDAQLAVRAGVRGEIVAGPARHRDDELRTDASADRQQERVGRTSLVTQLLWNHARTGSNRDSHHVLYDTILNTNRHQVSLMQMPASQVSSIQELMAGPRAHLRPRVIMSKIKAAMMSAVWPQYHTSGFGHQTGPGVPATPADNPKEQMVWAFYPESLRIKHGEVVKVTWPKFLHGMAITEVVKVKESSQNAPDLESPNSLKDTGWVYKNKAEGRSVHLVQAEKFGYHKFDSSNSASFATHIFECQTPETESLGGKYRPRLTVHLIKHSSHVKQNVALVVFCALIVVGGKLVAAGWLADVLANSVVIGEVIDCDKVESYCKQLEKMKDSIASCSGVFFICGFVFFVMWLLRHIVGTCWILPPKLSSFGRGFTYDFTQKVRVFSGMFLIIPLAFLVMFWASIVQMQAQLIRLMHVIDGMVDGLVDDMFIVIHGFDKMLDMLERLMAEDDLASVKQSIETFKSSEGNTISYAQMGAEAFVLLFTVLSSLTFWSTLIVVLAFASGASGILHRVPAQLRRSRNKSLLALAIILFVFGFNQFFLTIFDEFVDTYVDDRGHIVLDDGSKESDFVDMFISCNANGSSSLVPWQEILNPLYTTADKVLNMSCTESSCTYGTSLDEYTNAQLNKDLVRVRSDLQTFDYWIRKPGASLSELDLDRGGLTREILSEGIQGAIATLNVTLDMANCRQTRPFIFQLVALLDRKLILHMKAVSYTVALLAITTVAWMVIVTIAIRVLEKPRKTWYDVVSKRWFIFRWSFMTARNLRIKRGIESYVPDRVPYHCCNWRSTLLNLFYRDAMLNIYLLVCSCMLLSVDHSKTPNQTMVTAGSSCLLFGSIFGAACYRFEKWYDKVLHFLSLSLKTAALVLYVCASVDHVSRTADCWYTVEAGIKDPGPLPLNTHTFDCPPPKSPTSTCYVIIKTGRDLDMDNRIALLPSDIKCETGADPVGISEAATLWGRNYTFLNGGGIPAGVYNMCWSGKGGPYTKKAYQHFAGLLYVDEPVDRFKKCSIAVVAGFLETVLLCVSLLPHLLLVLCTTMCSCNRRFYRVHITDKMDRIMKDSNRHKPMSTGLTPTAVNEFTKNRRTFLRCKELLIRFWFLILVFIVALAGLVLPLAAGWLHSHKVTEISRSEISRSDPMLSQTSQTIAWQPSDFICATCCNMKQSNCGKTLDKVVFATSHNAMSSQKEQWLMPNNLLTVKNALQDGVRALMLDVHYKWDDDASAEERKRPTPVYLCHGYCTIGFSLLRETLGMIKEFLDSNPRELIVLILEQYVASSSMADELAAAGLTSFLGYTHPNASTPWPTLNQLLAQKHRLLIFSDKLPSYTGGLPSENLGSTYEAIRYGISGWHHTHAFAAETSYSYGNVDDMKQDCAIDRGKKVSGEPHRLTIMNHFVSNPLPCLTCAEEANTQGVVEARYALCQARWKHQVNFIAVDFWSVGQLTATVNDLNS